MSAQCVSGRNKILTCSLRTRLHPSTCEYFISFVKSTLEEEDMPWVCYDWPCSAHQKSFTTKTASPSPCARRRLCCSTWRWREACIPVASSPRSRSEEH